MTDVTPAWRDQIACLLATTSTWSILTENLVRTLRCDEQRERERRNNNDDTSETRGMEKRHNEKKNGGRIERERKRKRS
jgi:hypothetical protein